jgi:hypothetical protein
MNKNFIIFALFALMTSSVKINSMEKSILLQILGELKSLSPDDLEKLQKDPQAIKAIADAIAPDIKDNALHPEKLSTYIKNSPIKPLMKLVMAEVK